MKKPLYPIATILSLLFISGCSTQQASTDATIATESISQTTETLLSAENEAASSPIEAAEELLSSTEQTESGSNLTENTESTPSPEILHFVDVYGEEYEVEINPNIKKHTYQLASFIYENEKLTYTGDSNYSYRLGIDVSHYQDSIDWQAVKDSGIEFVFIRLGYRGYGEEGSLCLDKRFHQNIQNAQAAGLDVGVYFFAQAINEEEAKEEAGFVLQALSDYDLQLPVVYDPESILHTEARTDDVSGEQFTKNTIAFCETIADAGYQPMIYCNMLWEAYMLDLEQLSDYPVWYADYEALPQTPYHFEYWQYSNTGRVNGISGDVDLNIQLIPN